MVGLSRFSARMSAKLLDQHVAVLAGDLREGAVSQAPAVQLVAGRANFIDVAAVFQIGREGERFILFAAALVPILGRGGGSIFGINRQRQTPNGEQGRCGKLEILFLDMVISSVFTVQQLTGRSATGRSPSRQWGRRRLS